MNENIHSSVFSGIVSTKNRKPILFTNENSSVSIKVNLDINIEGKSEKIPLTSSLLYIPPEEPTKNILQLSSSTDTSANPVVSPLPIIPDIPLETYPRIPLTYIRLPAYPLKQLRYKEVVQFFFNKNVFAQRMEQWSKDSLLKSTFDKMKKMINSTANVASEIVSDNSPQRPPYLLSKREVENIQIEKENIELMLHLLFPAYAFHSEGYKTSMQYWNPYEPYSKNSFPKTQFSYIRHNGKLYTISNAVWLNDVFNTPFYRELIKYYEYYKDWKTERIQVLINAKERLQYKKEQLEDDEKAIQLLNKEEDKMKQVIMLLQKNIMEKKELDGLFKRSSTYSDICSKYLKINPFTQSKNQLYLYNLLFSNEKDRILSYSNERLNEIIYNESPPNTLTSMSKKTVMVPEKKQIQDKELLEKMLENILDYAFHRGNIHYLTRDICPKEGSFICHSSKEISTFYYTGILNQMSSRKEPSYEIYVLMDVIEGEVNKKNIAGIKCQYENQSIGKRLEHLTGLWPAWDLSNRRIFMKLDSKDQQLIISKTINEDNANTSISVNEQGEKRNLNENIQKRMEKWVEFDNQQTEHKWRNILEKLKESTKNYSEKNRPYMAKVKYLDWSFDTKENDLFLKWLQNPNKYPSPAEKETNDEYTAIDRKIYLFLEKMEILFQNKNEKSNKISEINTIVEQINSTISAVKRIIETNESKIFAPQWNYVKIIMEFYLGLLSFLINFLEYKKRKYQQEGAYNVDGGGEGAVEVGGEGAVEYISIAPPTPRYSFCNKTQRNHVHEKNHQKKRKTRKSGP